MPHAPELETDGAPKRARDFRSIGGTREVRRKEGAGDARGEAA
jgi:hypothetical protein